MKRERPFSSEARRALERARGLAEGGGIGPEHIFAAALEHLPGINGRLGWTADAFRQLLEPLPGEGYTAEADELVLRATRLTLLDTPGLTCGEQTLLGLLLDRECFLAGWTTPEQRRRGEELLTEKLYAGEAWTSVPFTEAFELAHSDGRIQTSAGDYLRPLLERPDSLAVKVLRELELDLDELEKAAREDRKPFHPGAARLDFMSVTPAHLAVAGARSDRVLALAARLGVIPFRLEVALSRAAGHPLAHEISGEKFPWLRPACEEAHRLGGGAVTELDLLLGLLADPECVACQAMQACGMDLGQLRLSLEDRQSQGEGFTPEAQRVLQRAAEVAGSLSPHDGDMLLGLLEVVPARFPDQLELVLSQRMLGSLDRQAPITVDGLQPGLSREQLIDLKGAPQAHGFEGEQEVWHYPGGLSMTWHPAQDAVALICGRRLEQAGDVRLQAGESEGRAREVLGRGGNVELAGGLKVHALVMQGQVVSVFLAATS